MTILAENTTAEVTVVDFRVIHLKRARPLAGTLLWNPELAITQSLRTPPSSRINTVSVMSPAGEAKTIALELDLDTKYPVITGVGNTNFFSQNVIALRPGQEVALTLIAKASKYSADFYLSLGIVGVSGLRNIKITNDGHPFTVSAGAGNWPSQSQPDFASYRSLYVASGLTTNPQWVAHNPQGYVAPGQGQTPPGA